MNDQERIGEQAVPHPSPNRRSLLIKAVIKGLLKSLTLSVLVMAPGLALLTLGFTLPGMIGLFLASFWLMARTYRRPWRLTTFSCLTPPTVALASYLLQLWLFAGAGLPVGAVVLAIGLGGFVGWWRGRSHQLYWEDGNLFAKRTFGYLVSWVLAYAFTQALAMTAASVLLIRAGLLTGAFTTTLLVVVSLMLQRQRRSTPAVALQNVAGMLFAVPFLAVTLLLTVPAWTQNPGTWDQDDPVVQELQAALDRGVAADVFGAALATGLNDELRLLQLDRLEYDTSEPDPEELLGFKVSVAKFAATTVADDLEIVFFMGAGDTPQTRLLIDMFGPSLLDKFHAWILKPDRETDNGDFTGTIERVEIGDYGLLIYGDGDGDSTALGVFLSNGRAIMVAIESKGRTDRVAAVTAMTTATMRYLVRMYTAGPGTFTAAAGKATAATVATLVMLTSAGIAISLAQAMAGAIAQAVQTTAESTTQAVTDALADAQQQPVGEVEPDPTEQTSEPATAPSPPPPRPAGPTLHDKEGQAFVRNNEGQYWAPDDKGDWRWLDQGDAERSAAALRGELNQRQAEQQEHGRETERILAESRQKIHDRNQAAEDAFRQRQQSEAAASEATRNRARRVAELMRKRGEQEGGALQAEVEKLIGQDNQAGLDSLLRERLRSEMASGQAESAAEQDWATAMSVGESVARATVAASKAALMAVGGPAGAGATGLAVGTVSAGEAGAESAVRGDSFEEFSRKTAVGFMSGFKDGAVSVYTNLPGTGKVGKILVPASADAAETYVRTGSGRQALVSGLTSVVSDTASGKVDGLGNVMGREVSSAAISMAGAEAANYANGGQLGDAYQGALINHLGAKAGGHLGNMGALHASDPEQRVRAALDAAQSGPREISLGDQAPIVQELDRSRYREPLLDGSGRPRLDADGEPVTGEFVNTRGALAQLQDTASSRTAKKAPDAVREAIIATRAEKIYGPANETTIRNVTPVLQKEGLLRRGDSVEMDSFSTPGSKPSLGADRDARLVIKRPVEPNLVEVEARLRKENPGLLQEGDTLVGDSSGRRQDGLPPGADPDDKVFIRRADGQQVELPRQEWESFDRIEVDRKHWERTALKDFHDHTTAIARSEGGEITPETQPEFFRRREELGFMRRPDTPEAVAALRRQGYSNEQIARLQQQGLSQEQIDQQAWAEAHNQLFTDRNHMEASRDNADQAFRNLNGRLEQTQKASNILGVQQGKTELSDAEGFGRMWTEKSSFYRHNKPEALAQSQKGIAGYMKVREGYRAQDIEPPPITDQAARAMEIVARAPVGVDATPEAMARVERDLQGLGYHDMNDALTKIAQQHEQLKWSQGGSASASVRDLGTSDISRIAGNTNTDLWAEEPE